MRKIAPLIILFVLFLFPKQVFASRNIEISADKSELSGDENLVIATTLSGFTEGETIYIKGAFYKEGTTNYFAYTKNGDDWIKNSETATSQKQVKIGDWDGNVTIKSDFADTGFDGSGNYKFKIGFYYSTSGGNLSSVNWSSNVLDINLIEPEPTPTPPAAKSSTASPSPSVSSASKQTTTTKKSPSPTPKPSDVKKESPEVLGQKDESTPNSSLTNNDDFNSPSPTPGYESESTQKIAGIFIGVGTVLVAISIAVYLWYKRSLDKPSIKKEKERFNKDEIE